MISGAIAPWYCTFNFLDQYKHWHELGCRVSRTIDRQLVVEKRFNVQRGFLNRFARDLTPTL
jgi:hypothetical protein